jgi:putative ABC transport system permease protein
MPEWIEHLRPRLAALRLSPTREAEIVEELSQHLDERYEELRAGGASDIEARRLALEELREHDALAHHMRALRQAHVPPPMTPGAPPGSLLADLRQDLRYAARMLRKQPGFAAAAVLTLALGIGAATAIFSLIDAAVLRALPFPDAHRLAVIWADTAGRQPGLPLLPPANADVAAWRGQNESFARIAAFSARTADLADGGDPERIGAAAVTAGFFETLGVTPLLGRTLAPDEEAPGGPPVALIGYGLWQRRFGGDPALLGKGVSINGDTRTIIGILPPEFDFPRGAEWPSFYPFAGRTEVWLPLAFRAQDDGTGWSNWQSRHERGLIAIGRLKPDTSLRQAQAGMDAFAARQAHDHPDTHEGWSLKLVPLREQMAGHSYTSLLILFAAVGLLLLIACVNVANLLLARGVARQQEIAVRAALGARRGRLMRQLLAECLLLSVFASGLGLLVAEGCLRIFLILNPVTHSRLDEASLDPAALGFAALVALLTSVLFGLVPALQASRCDLRKTLHDGGRGGDGAVRERVRAWLVAAEVALALVLLTTAGLMVRSFLRVQAVQPGFRSDSVLLFDLQLPASRYPTEASQIMLFEQLAARLEALPAVRAAGAISYLPLGGGENAGRFTVEGEAPVSPGNEPGAQRRSVTPGYFAAMGIPIRQGRVFTPGDTASQPRVVVINETIARQFFGSRDPLGRRLRAAGAWRTIVGVVADVKSSSLEREAGPQLYFPHAQWPWGGMTVVVHTEGNPLALVSAARGEVKALDALLPAARIQTMEQVVSNAAGARRFNMALLAFFAITALLLTMMGIYGVVAFLVGRRSREIGIRMAMGARRGDILRLVLRQGMKPVAIGSIGGLAGSLTASRLVASQLYGVSSSDPLTLASIIALLAAAALLACWLPARRATRVHPTEALRCE